MQGHILCQNEWPGLHSTMQNQNNLYQNMRLFWQNRKENHIHFRQDDCAKSIINPS
jgi:hypothetical protein